MGAQWFEFTKAIPSHLLGSQQPLHLDLDIAGIQGYQLSFADEELKTLGDLSAQLKSSESYSSAGCLTRISAALPHRMLPQACET